MVGSGCVGLVGSRGVMLRLQSRVSIDYRELDRLLVVGSRTGNSSSDRTLRSG